MTFQLSPGVYPFEIDKSALVTSEATNIGCAVAGLVRGPIGITLVTSAEKYEKLYGKTPASWSKADYCIKAALEQTSVFYVNRVVNGALYAGSSYVNDKLNNETTSAPFPTGSSLDYESGSRSLQLISIDSPLVAENKISVDVNNGEGSTEVVDQTFSTSSNETLATFAQKLQAALDKLGSGGKATVVDAWSSSDRNMQIALIFSQVLTAENCTNISGKISIMGGEPQEFSAAFNTDNDTTLNDLATSISSIDGVTANVKPGLTSNTANTILINCDTPGADSIVASELKVTGNETVTISSEVTKEGHGVYDDRVIQVIMPENSQAFLENPDISGGVSQASVDIQSNVKIMDIFAQNPGDWANDYGTKITNIDYGTASRFSITFTSALVASNVFSCDLVWNNNIYNISVPFNTSSDQTLKDISAKITETLSPLGRFGNAFVTEVVGGMDNDRVITVVSPDSSADIEILNALVTEGDTQATCIVAQTLDAIASNNTFTLEVYHRDNINSPVESFTVSFKEQVDGNGTQQYIEEVINNSSTASEYIRVKVNSLAKLELLSESESISWLNGGDNGAIPTNAQIVQGWQDFADPEKVTIRLMVNCGYTNVAVQQAMVSIAASRRDCFAILDLPSDKQSAEAAINYRKYELNVNSSYGAIYGPDLYITDDSTNMQLYIPPSGHVCAQYAYTDNTNASWWAPAGLNRGILSNVQGIRYKYDEGERDLLSQAQVNYIREMPGKGYVIWEEYTLQSKASALQDIHVRRLLITLEVSITDYLLYGLFDPNDPTSRSELTLAVEEYLTEVQRGRGFQTDSSGENGFMVQCDDKNNPDYLIDQGIMVMDVYIKPIRVIRFIKLNMIITKSSASFSELMAA